MAKVIVGVLVALVAVAAFFAAYSVGLLPSFQEPPREEKPSIPPPDNTPKPTSPEGSSVDFDLIIADIQGSGLSRDITAQITNVGDSDAHNVWAKVEVFSQGSRIRVNGRDHLREDIGIIKSGASITRQVTLSFSTFDGLKIASGGATFRLTIYSDEHTESFSYEYSP